MTTIHLAVSLLAISVGTNVFAQKSTPPSSELLCKTYKCRPKQNDPNNNECFAHVQGSPYLFQIPTDHQDGFPPLKVVDTSEMEMYRHVDSTYNYTHWKLKTGGNSDQPTMEVGLKIAPEGAFDEVGQRAFFHTSVRVNGFQEDPAVSVIHARCWIRQTDGRTADESLPFLIPRR